MNRSKLAMDANRLFAVLFSCCILAACTVVGPDYQRPNMELPENWPARQDAGGQPFTRASDNWWNLFADPVLDKLEDEALAHNTDVQIAVARVLEVRAQLGITEADQYPTVNANARESRTESSLAGAIFRPANFPRTQNSSHVTLDASYEIDLWGKFKRASEASRAELLAAESAKNAVRLSLTAQVAQQYFTLLATDSQESILRRVLDGWQETLVMDKKRAEVGVISEYEVHQAEAEAAATRSQLASIAQVRDRQESALALLLGRSPREVMSGKLDRGNPTLSVTWVPDGLPAELLLRRPDLREAEQRLMALNARIGVARAYYFPSIAITSYLGSESTSFASLFSGPAGIFQFATNISQPVFNADRLGYIVGAEEARRDQALIQYKQAVASAFADVRNALSAQDSARRAIEAENIRGQSLAQAYKQAELRFQNGISSRFELIGAERNYLQTKFNLLDAELNQRIAVSSLLKALGGGWRQ